MPLPDDCPCCGGELELERVADQYQEDIVVRCARMCGGSGSGSGAAGGAGSRARGRHPWQTSDALGAAGAQVGPHAVALAAQLNRSSDCRSRRSRASWARCAACRSQRAGCTWRSDGARFAAAPTYAALIEGVRGKRAVAADETGWLVAGIRQWLWVFVGDGGTVYLIAGGRGYEQAKIVLGAEFSGVLERDGWAPYRRFRASTIRPVSRTCSGARAS